MKPPIIRIAIAGASGKMGQAIMRLARADAGIMLQENTPREAASLFAGADLVIDFSRPEFTMLLAQEAARTGKKLVSGTTGLNAPEMQALKGAAQHAAVLWSANMSVGVNVLSALVAQAARALPSADIEILEMHHRHKIDAPSGTALLLGDSAAAARSLTLADVAAYDRSGTREKNAIGFAALRGGDVVGDHAVIFACDGERIELSHKASSRDIFATGALRAAHWLADKPNGFYTMRDVLGL